MRSLRPSQREIVIADPEQRRGCRRTASPPGTFTAHLDNGDSAADWRTISRIFPLQSAMRSRLPPAAAECVVLTALVL
jgi:hypothetical protein